MTCSRASDKKCCRGQSYRRNRHTLTEFSVPELPATKFLLQFTQWFCITQPSVWNIFYFFSRSTSFPYSSNLIHIFSFILKSSVLEVNHIILTSNWWSILSAIWWLPRAWMKITQFAHDRAIGLTFSFWKAIDGWHLRLRNNFSLTRYVLCE